MPNLGWECPSCHRCYSPTVEQCSACQPAEHLVPGTAPEPPPNHPFPQFPQFPPHRPYHPWDDWRLGKQLIID